jgi:hypothetical protein
VAVLGLDTVGVRVDAAYLIGVVGYSARGKLTVSIVPLDSGIIMADRWGAESIRVVDVSDLCV